MSNLTRDCTICGQAFWSVPSQSDAPAVCSECAEISASGEAQEGEKPAERPRFVALSALPPDKRLPPRRTGTVQSPSPAQSPSNAGTPSAPVMAGSTLPAPSRAENSRETAPSLPLSAPVRPLPVPPEALTGPRASVPVPATPASLRQIGFNCPSCFTVLVIKDPSSYDGRAAPCPYCAVTILPPRVAPPSPFTVLQAVALPPQEQAPAGRLRWTNLENRPRAAVQEVEAALA